MINLAEKYNTTELDKALESIEPAAALVLRFHSDALRNQNEMCQNLGTLLSETLTRLQSLAQVVTDIDARQTPDPYPALFTLVGLIYTHVCDIEVTLKPQTDQGKVNNLLKLIKIKEQLEELQKEL